MADRAQPKFVTPLVVLCLAAAGFFAVDFFDRSVWLDEANSVRIASQALSDMPAVLRTDGHPPLYYLFLAGWQALFGTGETAIRALSGVCYVAAVAAVFWGARTLRYDRASAALCAFFYLASPIAVRQAQNARMYSLLGLLVILSTVLFLRIFLQGERGVKHLAGYVGVNVAGTFTHYWFPFTVFAHAVAHTLVLRRPAPRRFWLALTASAVPFLLLWMPTFREQLASDVAAHIRRAGLLGLTDAVFDFYGRGMAVVVYTLCLAAVLRRREGARLRLRPASELAAFVRGQPNPAFLAILLASLLAPIVISQVKPIYQVGRFTIIGLFPFVMLLGGALGRLCDRRLVVPLCYTILLGSVGVFVARRLALRAEERVASDRATAAHLGARVDENAVVIYVGLSRLGVEYYLDRQGTRLRGVTFPAEIARHPGWANVAGLLTDTLSLHREGEKLARELGAGAVREVWVLYDARLESWSKVAGILIDELGVAFAVAATQPLASRFHSEAVVLRRRRPGPLAAAGAWVYKEEP